MGYRIDYSVTGGVLMATISGSCNTPSDIARDISLQARAHASRNILIDVRRLQDRVGRLRDLLADRDIPDRIAVLDSSHNERLYVFAEVDARARGCTLRRFDNQVAALAWLQAG